MSGGSVRSVEDILRAAALDRESWARVAAGASLGTPLKPGPARRSAWVNSAVSLEAEDTARSPERGDGRQDPGVKLLARVAATSVRLLDMVRVHHMQQHARVCGVGGRVVSCAVTTSTNHVRAEYSRREECRDDACPGEHCSGVFTGRGACRGAWYAACAAARARKHSGGSICVAGGAPCTPRAGWSCYRSG
jgi:hypothetical protein